LEKLGMTARRLYFCHSYAPEDRPTNEHIWRLLLKAGFYSWIDTGLDRGWTGQRLPMVVSFNEWMMSRCDGFVAVVPQRRSPYQRLEYRLAERMGLPRFVAVQQGGRFGAPSKEIVELPTSWSLFWKQDKQQELKAAIEHFTKRVDDQAQAHRLSKGIGRWRPRAVSDELSVALLFPRADDIDWIHLQALLQVESDVRWRSISPTNLRSEIELVSPPGCNEFDLLVLDVGPTGTPSELLGYLHALGMPQIRVCRVSSTDEEKALSSHLSTGTSGQVRWPYEQRERNASHPESLPRFLDGLKLDPSMEPVIFWQEPKDLATKLRATISRIEQFRSQLSPEEGGVTVEVSTHANARRYFAQRHKQTERAYVFISFAGSGAASKVPDRLAPILRFLNCRCFHYRDVDSHAGSRLETGEYIEQGLELRLEQADVVVLLIDEKFVESEYCKLELRQALELHKGGSLSLRAYALDPPPAIPDGLKDLSVFLFRELTWPDSEIEQKIINDVEESVGVLRRPLGDEERKQLLDWLDEDGGAQPNRVRDLLMRKGVATEELDTLDLNSKGIDSLLVLREDRKTHQRSRELMALLIMAAAEGRPERLKDARRWFSAGRLVGWPAPSPSAEEEVIVLDDEPAPLGTVEVTQAAVIGQQLGLRFRQLTDHRGPVCLSASGNALALPLEWARETADAEPIAVRRPIRWQLPKVNARGRVRDMVAHREFPPTFLALALAADDVEPTTETRQVSTILQDRYRELGWPPEIIRTVECHSREDLMSWLKGCRDHVVHIAGHLGPEGLQVGKDLVPAESIAKELFPSDVRLMVLNGCDGGTVKSPLAVEYLTLADRLVRDGRVPEVVAHRAKIAVSDALMFALSFYQTFFAKTGGFDAAQAVTQARKAGSARLRLCPIVISESPSPSEIPGD
jgi:hypothetical protein